MIRHLESLFSGLMLCVLTLLTGCDAAETLPENTALVIGVTIPQTGTLSNAGQSVSNGIHLAVREQADPLERNLTLALVDTRSTASGAQHAYRQLLELNDLPVIIGPLSSTATEAILPIIQESGITSMGPTSSKTGLSAQSAHLFRSSLTGNRIIPAGIRTAKQNLQFTNVATLHNSGDAFSVSSNTLITKELEAYADVTIAVKASFSRPPGTNLSESDIAAQLNQILTSEPPVDAIFLSGLPEDQITILPAAHRRKNTAPFIVNLLSSAEVETVEELEPGAAEGAVTFSIWLASSPEPLSRAFVKSYTQNFGMPPDDWAARGYAATSILIEALHRTSDYDPDSVQEALTGIKNFSTIYGAFSFNKDGDAIYNPVVAVVQDRDFIAWSIVN